MGQVSLLPTTQHALLHQAAVAQVDDRLPSLVCAVCATASGPGPTPSRDRPTTRTGSGRWPRPRRGLMIAPARQGPPRPLGSGGGAPRRRPSRRPPMRQLLAHTGGLAAEAPGPWWERTSGVSGPTLADILGENPQAPPAQPAAATTRARGTRCSARWWSAERGRPSAEVLTREVLGPLGMSRTSECTAEPFAKGWAVHPWADVVLPEEVHHTGLMAPAASCGPRWPTSPGSPPIWPRTMRRWRRDPYPSCRARRLRVGRRSYGLGTQILRSGARILVGTPARCPVTSAPSGSASTRASARSP